MTPAEQVSDDPTPLSPSDSPRPPPPNRPVQPVTHAVKMTALDELTRNLQPNAPIVTLEVGKGDEKTIFCIPHRMLAGMSTYLAQHVAANEVRHEQREVVLTLLNHDVRAWKVLLYTYMARSPPPMYFNGPFDDPDFGQLAEMLVECWIPGDKYDIVELQDLIMVELLKLLAGYLVHPKGIIAAALHARPDSKLYDAMMKAMAQRLHRHYPPGQIPTVTQALERDDIALHFVDRINQLRADGFVWPWPLCEHEKYYMSFMVDGGPRRHWMNVPSPFRSSHEELNDVLDDDADNRSEGSDGLR